MSYSPDVFIPISEFSQIFDQLNWFDEKLLDFLFQATLGVMNNLV